MWMESLCTELVMRLMGDLAPVGMLRFAASLAKTVKDNAGGADYGVH